MKKLIVAVAFVCSGIAVKAQNLQLIPKAGINISKQAISSLTNEKMKVGFQGGLGLNIPIAKSAFSLQPEINFISKGTKVKAAGRERDINLNYLEVPLLAKYAFGPVYVNAGPSIGLLLTKNDKLVSNYGSKLEKIDVGVQMGAGVALPVGPGKIIVDGRYALGLSNIAKVGSIKNRGIMASIGYAIPFK